MYTVRYNNKRKVWEIFGEGLGTLVLDFEQAIISMGHSDAARQLARGEAAQVAVQAIHGLILPAEVSLPAISLRNLGVRPPRLAQGHSFWRLMPDGSVERRLT